MIRRPLILAAIAALCLAGPASAQVSGLGSLGGLSGKGLSGGGLSGGGLAGLGGGLMPNVSSIGAGNAAGLLGYCVKRKLLGGGDATSLIGKLTGKPGVAQSKGFADGTNGSLDTSSGIVSLDGVKDKVKGKVCEMVLDHAQSFAGR